MCTPSETPLLNIRHACSWDSFSYLMPRNLTRCPYPVEPSMALLPDLGRLPTSVTIALPLPFLSCLPVSNSAPSKSSLQWVLGLPSSVSSARYSEEQCTASIIKTRLSWEPTVVGLGHAPLLNWSHVCQRSLVQDLQIQGNDPWYLSIVITCLQC